MVVTKPVLHRIALAGTVILALVFGFQNCAVDNSNSTPGASGSLCNPDSTTLAAFSAANDFLQGNGNSQPTSKPECVTCHGSGGIGSGFFSIDTTSPTVDLSVLQINYCTLQNLTGPTILSVLGGSSNHTGGVYTSTDAQPLYDFINTYLQ